MPKIEELKEILKLLCGHTRNIDWMLMIYTLHTWRVSLRKRKQILKKFRFPDKKMSMNYIYIYCSTFTQVGS